MIRARIAGWLLHPGLRGLLYHLTFASLIAHELDAVARHEWRLLPGLDALPDDVGLQVFVVAHIPLLATLTWLGWSASARTQAITRFAVAAFAALHSVLHFLFLHHPLYEFDNFLSISLIHTAASFGLVYVGLDAWAILLRFRDDDAADPA